MNPFLLLWGVFVVVVVGVSIWDLAVVTRGNSSLGVKPAMVWTGIWVAVALGFGSLVYAIHPDGKATALLFVTGFITEYSLSIDNLFVFILIFSMMGVQEQAQPKLIKAGILLAIVLRVVCILFGVALVEQFEWMVSAFGMILVWTSWKMFFAKESSGIHPEKSLIYRGVRRLFPIHNPGPASTRMFVRHGGRLYATPLFLAFVVIGSTNVVFAMDSIPAIIGISQDPFIVITSSIFAVLGLGSLFFAIRGIMSMFRFLQQGVSLVLLFIGTKMILDLWPPVSAWFRQHPIAPLAVISAILLVSVGLSVLLKKSGEAA